ncbi:MAG: YkgJ family cysteine cluster protein [Candidatus Omnitrophica bacterium]|nr:YkgJ family cysteine cluster protein [Candidatus Omnitrophota bacterium]
MVGCHTCESKCCRYFGLEIDTPTVKEEFENIRWYLAHKGVTVFVEKKKWYLEVDSKCQFLTKDRKCGIYENRPLICKEHCPSSCENALGEFDHQHTFKSMAEFDKYLDKRFRRKKKK